jgi:hypothetical protein
MAKNLLEGKLIKDKVQKQSLTPEQIEEMHQAMTAPLPSPTPSLPSVAEREKDAIELKRKPSKNKKIELEVSNENITRLSIDVSKEMHKAMKIKIIETEQSIRDYVVALIRKDLGLK